MLSALTAGTITLVATPFFYNLKGSKPIDFHLFNDNKGFLQVDKFRHSYSAYCASNIWYNCLESSGFSKKTSLLLGGTIGTLLLLPKEIYDGFHRDGGFSCGDILANAAGSGFFISQELLFDDQILKYKSSFTRSNFADQANGFLGNNTIESYFLDYNGHTYWLSININKIIPKSKLPDWINFAAGYSANGMFGIFENIDSYEGVDIPETQRYRQFLVSLDIDWSNIKVKSKFLRTVFHGMNFIRIPFPTFEINTKGEFKGYWLYF